MVRIHLEMLRPSIKSTQVDTAPKLKLAMIRYGSGVKGGNWKQEAATRKNEDIAQRGERGLIIIKGKGGVARGNNQVHDACCMEMQCSQVRWRALISLTFITAVKRSSALVRTYLLWCSLVQKVQGKHRIVNYFKSRALRMPVVS
jgi:hypothetical protein